MNEDTSSPSPSPSSHAKKRKSLTGSLEREGKKRKKNPKFSESETTILIDAYKYHDGDWSKIMMDEKIKKLNRNEKNLRNRIEYIKKKKNEAMKSQRGTQMRETIVNEIEESQTTFEDMHDNIDNYNRDDFFDDDTNVTNGNGEQEEFTQQQQIVHDMEAELVGQSIDSDEIQTSDDYQHAAATLKTRKQIRNERIRQKGMEHRAVINDIRDQRKERTEYNQVSQTLMMMLIQQMKENEQEKREQRQMQQLFMNNMMETLRQNQMTTMMTMKHLGFDHSNQHNNNNNNENDDAPLN